jgi:hypothetical protein
VRLGGRGDGGTGRGAGIESDARGAAIEEEVEGRAAVDTGFEEQSRDAAGSGNEGSEVKGIRAARGYR